MTSAALHQKLMRAFALHQSGRLGEAEPLYREILQAAPRHFDALHMLGVVHLQTGRHQQAFRLIDKAVGVNPSAAVALNNHGNALQALERYQEALLSYERALQAKPDYDEAHRNRGDVLRTLGRHAEALASYAETLRINPTHAEALNNRGVCLMALGRAAEAIADFDRAVQLKPRYAAAINNRGDALRALERHEEALESYRKAFAVDPTFVDALANSGGTLRALQRYDEALAVYDNLLKTTPNHIKALNNRGAVLRDLQRHTESLASFDKALALQPRYIEALVNRGTTLHEMGREAEALAAYDAALSIDPRHADSHWNKALTLLTLGRYAEGWTDFEWRRQCRDVNFSDRAFTQPPWTGETLGPTEGLLVWGEQGIGDEILYGGMVGDLVDQGFAVTWECDTRLVPLIRRSYPGIDVVARTTPPDPLTGAPALRAQISTASLGQYLRTDARRFPDARRSYLKADETRAQDFRRRLLTDGGTRLIGVSWVSKNMNFGAHKSSSLADLAPIWEAAGLHTRFVDLQYGDTATERAGTALALTHMDDLDLYNDIDGLAALIRACDLVISVSNTTAHLAGALGVPVWVMVPNGIGKLWYWGGEQARSPWYPSAMTFKQTATGGWDDVMTRIAQRITDAP